MGQFLPQEYYKEEARYAVRYTAAAATAAAPTAATAAAPSMPPPREEDRASKDSAGDGRLTAEGTAATATAAVEADAIFEEKGAPRFYRRIAVEKPLLIAGVTD